MKLNILFISSWFPSRVHPTLGNFVVAHAEAAALFNDVSVLYIKGDDVNKIEIEEEQHHEIQIIRVYYPKEKKFIGRLQALKAGMEVFGKADKKFDVVQLNMVWNEGWQAVYLKKKYKLPFVISDNWTGYHPEQRTPQPWHVRKYMKWVANQAALLLPVTRHLEKAMRNLGFNKPSIIIPNAVDLSTFKPNNIPTETVRFLHISHLDQEHKNIAGILIVWSQFAAHRSDVHLAIGGDGDWQYWQAEAFKRNIPSASISFFGPQNKQGVAKLMGENHCLVLFSNYENLPLVMVEAMACGLSVIATSVGGIAEHITNHPYHKLIERKQEKQLLVALEQTASEVNEVDRASIHRYAIEQFGLDAVGKAFTNAYLSVLKK
ncbi:MAG: glycosyltransferase [Cryomorphaceae bacterium]|nr:glycosyltransferase [Cryomorphaceae bacterium]